MCSSISCHLIQSWTLSNIDIWPKTPHTIKRPNRVGSSCLHAILKYIKPEYLEKVWEIERERLTCAMRSPLPCLEMFPAMDGAGWVMGQNAKGATGSQPHTDAQGFVEDCGLLTIELPARAHINAMNPSPNLPGKTQTYSVDGRNGNANWPPFNSLDSTPWARILLADLNTLRRQWVNRTMETEDEGAKLNSNMWHVHMGVAAAHILLLCVFRHICVSFD